MKALNFIVMGAGAWGTAMSIYLNRLGYSVALIPRNERKAKIMRENSENSFYLPGIVLPKTLIIDTRFERYLNKNSIVCLACPLQGLMSVCQQLKPLETSIGSIISLIKGMDPATLQTPSQIIQTILPTVSVLCLSGPTYALEFAQGKPAAMVLASHEDTRNLQQILKSEMVRIYHNSDLLGVELGSCLKNVYAIGAGIIDGLKYGDNFQAAYLTRALHEIKILGVTLGGRKETFYGLSGLGDLIATTQGTWSRNRQFGYAFAQGQNVDTLLKKTTVEGYGNINCFYKKAQNNRLDIPILQALYQIFYENITLNSAIRRLMEHPIQDET